MTFSGKPEFLKIVRHLIEYNKNNVQGLHKNCKDMMQGICQILDIKFPDFSLTYL